MSNGEWKMAKFTPHRQFFIRHSPSRTFAGKKGWQS
jgi:hypothetical protein